MTAGNEKRRPHIVIFNPDEMRADALHHLGNSAAITPNLDTFQAKEAVSFSNAFCQNPVCVPSRCSFFTGLYPHTGGHRTMAHLLRPGEDTLFSELKQAGYYVWMNDRNDLTAGQIPGWTESHASEIYYGNRCAKPAVHEKALRGDKGSKYYYSHFDGRLKSDPKEGYYSSDDEIVDAAIDRIRTRPKDRPLCMFLGLMYPHVPYEIEEPYYSAIKRSEIPPRIHLDDCSGKARILSEIRSYCGMDEFTEEDWTELRAVYLAMCMKIDCQFGKLVNALKEAGIYEDTAIFFLSDHGDFTGDYDLPEKAQNTFEHCLTNVPFLVKPPRGYELDPGICDSLVELVDFYATAMDFAGVEPSHSHFGLSLRELIGNRTRSIRDFVCCEGGRNPGEIHCDEYHVIPGGMPEKSVYWPKAKAQTDDLAHEKGIMLFDGRYKYVSRILCDDELYDLEQDPEEKYNIIDDPDMLLQTWQMKDKMLKWLERTADIVPFEPDARFTGEMMWARCRNLVPPEKEEEVRQKIRSGISLPMLMQYCRSLH